MNVNCMLLILCCVLSYSAACGEPGTGFEPSAVWPIPQDPFPQDPFHSIDPPGLDSVSPSRGPSCGGSLVTLVGQNFPADAVVRFGNVPATNVSVWSATRLTAQLPPSPLGSGSVSVTVENSNGQADTRSGLFTYHGCGLTLPSQVFDPGGHTWLISADLNQDGRPDVISNRWDTTRRYGQPDLSVSLGAEDGGFVTPRIVALGFFVTDAVAGDWNGDRVLDLVVTNFEDPGRAALLVGDGRGGFAAPRFLSTGKYPRFPRAGDWNGDGTLDLVLAANSGYNIYSLYVFLGDGSGGFGAARLLPFGSNPSELLTSDVDRDGRSDLVFFTDTGLAGGVKLNLLRGDGAGGFLVSTGPSPFGNSGIMLLDVNRDGRIDLVGSRDETVQVSLGDGTGGFSPATSATSVAIDAHMLSTGDLNQDGIPDLIALKRGSNQGAYPYWVLLGRGDGTFPTVSSYRAETLMPFSGGTLQNTAVVGDFNGDSLPDLLRATEQGLVLDLGDGTGRLATPARFPSPSALMAVGDLNQDQNLDLVGDGGAVTVLGDGRGGAVEIGAGTPFPGIAQALLLADVNGDRGADLIGSTLVGGVYRVGVKLASGRAAFGLPTDLGMVSTSAHKLVAADFNGDSRVDLAILDVASRTLNIVFGDGLASFSNRTTLSLAGTSPVSLATADLNSDRTPDLVLGQKGAVIVLLGNGTGGFGTPRSSSLSGTASYLAMGDMNGDGQIDLVYSDPSASASGLLLGDGLGGLTMSSSIPVAVGATCGVLADLNADSKLDLVLGGTVLQAALGDGKGGFAAVQAFEGSTSVYCPIIGEFTGDGRIDVLARDRLFFGQAQ